MGALGNKGVIGVIKQPIAGTEGVAGALLLRIASSTSANSDVVVTVRRLPTRK